MDSKKSTQSQKPEETTKLGKRAHPEEAITSEVKEPRPKRVKGEPKPEKTTGSGAINLMLAETIEKAEQDPTGWLMSEKLDGVRCYWNGSRMYTRNQKPFYPPKWFKDALPKDLALDGELWTQRNDFQNVVRIVRKQD